VLYSYDERGRLVRVASSDGTVRQYEYDAESHLVGVREPGRILRNTFDEAGRWVGQVLKNSEHDDDPYVAKARYVLEDGAIVESEFDEGDGLEVTRYNREHYVVSETLHSDTPAPIVFTYHLDPVSNVPVETSLSCMGASGPVTRSVPMISAADDEAKDRIIRENCTARR
jgi:YD repeat-containing protein